MWKRIGRSWYMMYHCHDCNCDHRLEVRKIPDEGWGVLQDGKPCVIVNKKSEAFELAERIQDASD